MRKDNRHLDIVDSMAVVSCACLCYFSCVFSSFSFEFVLSVRRQLTVVSLGRIGYLLLLRLIYFEGAKSGGFPLTLTVALTTGQHCRVACDVAC